MIENVLAVVAHPDDLEIMAGGSIVKWKKQGKKIHVLLLTDGAWKRETGTWVRSPKQVQDEIVVVKESKIYDTLEQLAVPCLSLNFEDHIVCEVLKRIENYKIDTLLTSWIDDTHHDHEIASRIVLAASRRVSTVLMGQINYYTNKFFTPNIFVDITEEWDDKIKLVSLYESQWSRAKEDWCEFMDITSKYYGKIVGVSRAEGFITNKLLLDLI